MGVAGQPVGAEQFASWAKENPRGAARLLAKADCDFFMDRFVWLRDWQRGVDFKLKERPIQTRLRHLMLEQKHVVGLKARGVGWTSVMSATVLWECWNKAPYQCLYLCNREDNAKEFIDMISLTYRLLQEKYPWLGFPQKVGEPSQSKFEVATGEGLNSEVLVFPSLPSALQTWHPTRIIADEWGLIPEKVLPSALPAVTPNGYFVGLGTAEGLSNEHAEVYISCRDGYAQQFAPQGKQFWHIFASWKDNPDTKTRPSGGSQKDTERMYPLNDQEAFALTFPGEPVYSGFRAAVHVSKKPLKPYPMTPIYRFWDCGNTPACVWFQITPLGQGLVLKELQEYTPGARAFARQVASISVASYPDFDFIDFGDPSGHYQSQSDGESFFDLVKDETGIKVRPGESDLTSRFEAVNDWLERMVEGKAALVIDPSCRIMIAGFMGAYHFPEDRHTGDLNAFREYRDRERRKLMERVNG